MTTNNKETIIFVLLTASIFFNVMPALAVPQDNSNNPYSLQWWYNYQVFDDDNDDHKKKHVNHNSKHNNAGSDYKPKQYCAGSGYWNGKECIINDEVEKAAYEDAVCDDPKDTQKYTSVCGGNSNNKVDEKRKSTEHRDANSDIPTIKQIDDGYGGYASEYKAFQKQHKEQHPELYPEQKKKVNPAEETGHYVPIVDDEPEPAEEEEKEPKDNGRDTPKNDDDSGGDDGDSGDKSNGKDSSDDSGDSNDSESNDNDNKDSSDEGDN